MVGLKFSVHPLFYLFGLYFAITGKVFSFLVYTFTAVVHELGHFFCSERLGYQLNRIVLMPYGAVIRGDDFDVSYKHECLIALGGPLINFVIAIICVAFWWLVPDTYPYTQLIVTANVSIAVINLLPCYPLDGGRFLLATLSLLTSRKKAKLIVKILAFIFTFILLALFVYSLFTTPNVTVLFFALFVLFGASGGKNSGDYVKIYSSFNFTIKQPKEVKKIAVVNTTQVRKLYSYLNGDYYYEILVITPNGEVVLGGEKLYSILSKCSPYDTIAAALQSVNKLT